MTRFICCFAVAALLSSTVSAEVVIDFQELEHQDADFEVFGNTFTEDGFILSEGSGGDLGTAGTMETRYSGSTAVAGTSATALYILTQQGGGPFGVNSIDLAEFTVDENSSATVTFTGILEAGGIATQSFTLDGTAFTPETFSFNSNFNSVVALVWNQSTPGHQFDNINVSVVPEPTAAIALIAGLTCVLARRRR